MAVNGFSERQLMADGGNSHDFVERPIWISLPTNCSERLKNHSSSARNYIFPAASLFPHARIEMERAGRRDPKFATGRMGGIEQEIRFRWNNRRGHLQQGGFAGRQPGITDSH